MSAAHVFKKVQRKACVAAAVAQHGDNWLLGVPLPYWPSEKTFDWKEALRMVGMERGIVPRISELSLLPSEVEAYPAIHVHAVGNCGFHAYREGYDMDDPLGSDSWSRFKAIADLLEQEEMRGEQEAYEQYERAHA